MQSAADNRYERVSPHKDAPPLQVAGDGPPTSITLPSPESEIGHGESSDTTAPTVLGKGSDLHSSPPLPPLSSEEDPSVSAYALTSILMSSKVPPPPAADGVVYFEVKGYQNPQVLCTCTL